MKKTVAGGGKLPPFSFRSFSFFCCLLNLPVDPPSLVSLFHSFFSEPQPFFLCPETMPPIIPVPFSSQTFLLFLSFFAVHFPITPYCPDSLFLPTAIYVFYLPTWFSPPLSCFWFLFSAHRSLSSHLVFCPNPVVQSILSFMIF